MLMTLAKRGSGWRVKRSGVNWKDTKEPHDQV